MNTFNGLWSTASDISREAWDYGHLKATLLDFWVGFWGSLV